MIINKLANLECPRDEDKVPKYPDNALQEKIDKDFKRRTTRLANSLIFNKIQHKMNNRENK